MQNISKTPQIKPEIPKPSTQVIPIQKVNEIPIKVDRIPAKGWENIIGNLWQGYLFLRNFGNLGTCLETTENFGSLPKFSEILEEFTGWFSSEDDHSLIL